MLLDYFVWRTKIDSIDDEIGGWNLVLFQRVYLGKQKSMRKRQDLSG